MYPLGPLTLAWVTKRVRLGNRNVMVFSCHNYLYNRNNTLVYLDPPLPRKLGLNVDMRVSFRFIPIRVKGHYFSALIKCHWSARQQSPNWSNWRTRSEHSCRQFSIAPRGIPYRKWTRPYHPNGTTVWHSVLCREFVWTMVLHENKNRNERLRKGKPNQDLPPKVK